MKSFTASVFSVIALTVKSADMFDIEDHIIEGFKGMASDGSNLVSYENERGRPMMHAAIDDSKCLVVTNLFYRLPWSSPLMLTQWKASY